MEVHKDSNPRHYARLWRNGHDGCPVCGLEYVRESEADRRIHRARHRKVLQVYEPKPDPVLAAHYAAHGTFLPLDSRSPLRLRNRLEGMAIMFRRELSFDFPPYSATEADPLPWNDDCKPAHHWLIVTPDGRPIGGFSARWREWTDAPAQWMWAWVWVIPSERRTGHVQRCWALLKAKFPNIQPEPPFSYPVAKFFANRDDVSELTRRLCGKTTPLGPVGDSLEDLK